MTRISASWVVILLLLATGWDAWAEERLVFCVEAADVRPWRTRDGQGLNFILLNRVARKIGVDFSFKPMTWARCLAQLKAGEVDGALAASFKQDRLAYGSYPGGAVPDPEKRLHLDRYVVLRRVGSAVGWNGQIFSALDGRVGVQLGYSALEQLQMLGVPLDDGAQSPDALVQKLATGRIAAATMLEGEARTLLASKSAYANAVEILPIPLVEKPYYLMISNKLVNSNPRIASRVWQGIETVRKSSDYMKEEQDALRATFR